MILKLLQSWIHIVYNLKVNVHKFKEENLVYSWIVFTQKKKPKNKN